ncbi:hypothetical protein [Shewanella sp. Isolate7]|uniref:hypothetical protein n=1 Tax=Shewanella sp. Isolate7 TaxID=2908528 RepID=UPI001EFC8861|nr:hypothetical protein [Shewanella sp. Isolate7]MCG9723469.1 hypothetical protein [Shewanella sp. Isolate7]
MSYWFGYRVFDKSIDLSPGAEILEGPFDSYEDAKKIKITMRGSDMQKTSIFKAISESAAKEQLKNESWMI